MNWRVSNAYTLSDHRVIRYTTGSKCHRVAQGSGFPAWKTQCFNEELFIEALRFGNFSNTSSALELVPAIANACDTSVLRRKGGPYPRQRAYWWTTEIAQCRSHCIEARRKMNRAKSSEQREDLRRLYILAWSNLKRKIKASKRRCFLALCDEVENNPFGAYRMLMGKMVGQDLPRERNPTVLKSIIEQLFPIHEPNKLHVIYPAILMLNLCQYPLINYRRLQTISNWGKPLVPMIFPLRRSKQLSMCIRKLFYQCSGKPPGDASALRPLGLIDNFAKILILNRWVVYTEGEHGLSDRQFGFRKGRSTGEAIAAVLKKGRSALLKKRTFQSVAGRKNIDLQKMYVARVILLLTE